MVYVEASGIRAVDHAIEGARASGFSCKITSTVNKSDYPKVLRHLAGITIRPNSWATFVRGVYRDDGCFVESVSKDGKAVVWCIPRLDLSPRHVKGFETPNDPREGMAESGGQQDDNAQVHPQGAQSKKVKRWAPRLFDPLEVARVYGEKSVRECDGEYTFRGQVFRGGLTRRLVDIDNLSPKVRFSYLLYCACSLAPQIPPDRVAAFLWYYYGKSLQLGDRVDIIDGQQSGGIGRIIDLHGDFATVDVEGLDIVLDVHLQSLRRRIVVGDTVRVEVGVNRGKWGPVVEVFGEEITIISPNTTQEVRSCSHMLYACADINPASC